MSRRPFWFVLGLLAVGAGVTAWAAGVRLPRARLQSLAIVGAIVVAGLAAVAELLVRSLEEPAWNTLPTPATAGLVRTPGDELDERAANGEWGLLRRRARDAGAAVLARRSGRSRSEARERLEAGTWTGDEDAASFLRSERPRPPLRERIDAALGGADPDRRRAERATRALLAVDEDERRGRTESAPENANGSGETRDRSEASDRARADAGGGGS